MDLLPAKNIKWSVERNEQLLLTTPEHRGPVKFWEDYPPLDIVHFSPIYKPSKFSPPKSVYEGPTLRLEWQDMNFRQPFFHRNADVDEISFQIAGERTLMTEMGVAEIRPGDFSRIPVAVAHDSFGRNSIHLLFYVQASAEEFGTPRIHGEYRIPPFEGWENKVGVEMFTHCLGSPECDIAVSLADEEMTLSKAKDGDEKLRIITHSEENGITEWMYKTKKIWIGSTKLDENSPQSFTRRLAAEEIQYQVEGERELTTQRGKMLLKAGDFVSIPLGCAHKSTTTGNSHHITILTTEEAPRIADVTRSAT